jgi:hypothetical protein
MNSARRSTPDLSGAKWRSSTYSGGNNECVEVADDLPTVPVRDSKRPTGPALDFSRAAWQAFVAHLN